MSQLKICSAHFTNMELLALWKKIIIKPLTGIFARLNKAMTNLNLRLVGCIMVVTA